MRRFGAVLLAALGGLTMTAAAHADTVPPFKGNDTGGIISAALVGQADFRALASAHCAQYGKVARFVSHDRRYGQYTSFACRWVPAGHLSRPLRVRY
ncbi:MAG: hypothetical protein DCC74_00910 [Proteobacteria bacterium]|nr:MAG: hypothetical protein DCC74_00910 [Pseudomonadota bacterium]